MTPEHYREMFLIYDQIAVAHFTGEARPARAGNQRFPAALPELLLCKSLRCVLKEEAARMPPDEFTRYAFSKYRAPGMSAPLVAMVQLLTGRCADAEQKSIQNGV